MVAFSGSNEEYQQIAQFYDAKSDWANAGDFYFKSGHYSRALKHYLRCGDSQINKAIDVVGKARTDRSRRGAESRSSCGCWFSSPKAECVRCDPLRNFSVANNCRACCL